VLRQRHSSRSLDMMRQLVLRAGTPQVVEVPAPSPEPGRVLVANLASVISSGTERSAVASGGGGGPLPLRAVRNPGLVKKALEHIRDRGLRETFDIARGVTAPDAALGYSSAGVVLDTGGISAFRVGQLVACAGAGAANHAEVVSVPGNLVVAVPDEVDVRAAAFTTLGAIALQGVRRVEPTLGERVVVVGLGLVGLLTVQLLRAAGCQVFGIEPVERRRKLAGELGIAETADPAAAAGAVSRWTEGVGADAVVICAAAPGSDIANAAVALLRRKGRIVPVGEVGLGFDRAALYLREADVLISTSYGPGRYDPTYEEAGVDYPLPYVRWTENRNMAEVLRLLAAGHVNVDPLVDLELPVERAPEAYSALATSEPPLAAVLLYSRSEDFSAERSRSEVVRTSRQITGSRGESTVRVALIGAGSFVTSMHVPTLAADDRARIVVVANRRGSSASDAARRAGGADATTDWRGVLERDDVDLVLIGTRHDSHAEIAEAALRAGKAVFVEKPLGLSRAEIDAVWDVARANDRLAIGFNRPFSHLARTLERELRSIVPGPVFLVYRVSAPGPPDHWLNDSAVGGGRLLGEACHMFDFANWLCGTPERVFAAALPSTNGVSTVENSAVTIQYSNGSVATLHYTAVGSDAMPKERIELMGGGHAWVLDDFVSLTSYAGSRSRTQTARARDKGHATLMKRVLTACRSEAPFEPGIEAAYAAQAVALAALESVATAQPVAVVLAGR
jgi:predicted dehydrogenase/threonine dehydrogenase-like Zn-dependent dehydrogenase